MVAHLSHSTSPSPLGPLTLIAQSGILSGVRMASTPAPDCVHAADAELLTEATAQLAAYFEDPTTSFAIPLAPPATPLADAVRQVLDTVGIGMTLTYGTLADRVDRPGSARALGSVLGANPLLIVVPCHRVIATGGLGGYAGGQAAKRWLLEHESGY